MTLDVRAGRMTITDGAATIFDSDDDLFHVLSSANGTAGPFFYESKNLVGVDISDAILLGAVNAACTDVIGAIRIRYGSGGVGLVHNRWHTVCGGTAVVVWDGEAGQSNVNRDNLSFSQFVGYTFRVAGGKAYLDRRVVMRPTSLAVGVVVHHVDFKLKCGVWV